VLAGCASGSAHADSTPEYCVPGTENDLARVSTKEQAGERTIANARAPSVAAMEVP